MNILLALFLRILGPMTAGLATARAIHGLVGWVAVRRANGDDSRFQQITISYIKIISQLRDILFMWAIGVILFMAAGLI